MGYARYFMPLENEASGYDFKGRTPAGRAIVENRDGMAKLSVWAQDIRTEARYAVYLVFPDGGRYTGVPAGNLLVDLKGKAELKKEIEPAALGKFALEDLTAVAVVAEGGPARSGTVVSPLVGYRDRPVSWRGSFETVKKEEAKTPPPAVAEVTETVPEVIEAVPVTVAEAEPPATDLSTELSEEEKAALREPVAPERVENVPKETELIPKRQYNAPRARKPDAAVPIPRRVYEKTPSEQAIPHDIPPGQAAPADSHAVTRTDSRAEGIDALENIFNSKKLVTPFENQSDQTIWVQLTINDPVPLPLSRPHLLEEPFIRAAYANFDHLLLGLSADRHEYIIGVPGEFSPELVAQAKRLGFSVFRTGKKEAVKPGDFGYWLMNIGL